MKRKVTYLARPFEAADEKTQTGWVDELYNSFDKNKLIIYDAAKQEANKTELELNDHINLTHSLFANDDYDELLKEMNYIWWNKESTPDNMIAEFLKFRHPHNCNIEDWGDFEAVIRSDFIIVYFPIKSYTVGMYYEMLAAYIFKIPIYFILEGTKNMSKLEIAKGFNKTLFMSIYGSGGRHFYNVQDCVQFIKSKYDI